ncbi:MAG: ATP-binding protein [Prevotellaceae bacterium]|jgi:AAA+ ATPase superfamily predicted ATPase|nr:ATP-binding protein [Prevotellaceae bacterium]
MIKNPFIVSGYAEPDYFCDRKKESAELIRKTTNGNNLVLISPRRMGKTGLIEHCFRNKKICRSYYTFYVDIYATSGLQELIFLLGKVIFDTLKPRGKKFIDKFFSIIGSLRPAFKLDATTGEPVFDIGIGEIRQAAFSLNEIFQYLEAADKHCIVAIDEFQQIAHYPEPNIEALLRTNVQQCRNATFIFSGSERHVMQNMFFAHSRPFYQSAAMLTLEAIDEAVYTEFVQRHFAAAGKNIAAETVKKAYRLFEGHTWYMQATFNEIFSMLDAGETCTDDVLRSAIESRIASYESMFSALLALLPERQKLLLYAIAKEGKASAITSGDFIKRHALPSASSVQTSAKQLADKEIITSENNVYQVYDRFFGLWLTTVFGTGYRIPQ